jgi:hypothetical protein
MRDMTTLAGPDKSYTIRLFAAVAQLAKATASAQFRGRLER